MRSRFFLIGAVTAAVLLGVPGSASADPDLVLPPAGGQADYQLGGAYEPPAGTQIVERDRAADPAPGMYGICYFNGFQTQPAENGWWQENHPELLLRDESGATVEDPHWAGEMVLDTFTATKREAIAGIEYAWIDGCAKSGFSAIDADNLDSWTRSHDLLNQGGNIELARLLNDRAHLDGLASAQKNSPELGALGPDAGFDFATAEDCGVYDECGAYTSVYDTRVIEVEYTDTGQAAYDKSCADSAGTRSIMLRDRLMTTPSAESYAYQSC